MGRSPASARDRPIRRQMRLTGSVSGIWRPAVGRDGAPLDLLPERERARRIGAQRARGPLELVRREASLLQDFPACRGSGRTVERRPFRATELRHRGDERRIADTGHQLAAAAGRDEQREECRMMKTPHGGVRLVAAAEPVKH